MTYGLTSILGIGTDIVEVARIEAAIQEHGSLFLNRLFTPQEQAYCQKCQKPAGRFAGRFAAKEAVAKSLGIGFGKHLSWLDFSILNDMEGKPEVVFIPSYTGRGAKKTFLISISHCNLYATATAICGLSQMEHQIE